MPLWVWNGDITDARIDEMLDQFAANGIGGVFIHPRPGLVTEYLSEAWFDRWRYALAACEARGLECHLYDENSFPSGFAGGHTRAADPESVIRCVVPTADGTGWDHGKVNGWTAHQPLVALTRAATTQTFLHVTHEQYVTRFGKAAGRTWKYCFTDEPTLRCEGGLYATPDFLAAFQAEHGYDLIARLNDYLAVDPARSWPVRFDYWSTANRLFTQHFCRAMHDWCAQHDLQFTGHFDEHEWPNPRSMPDAMAAQRWMHAPGIDLLGFQYNAGEPGANALYDLTIIEAVSVAAQCGRRRIFCECYGGGGYQYTLDQARSMSVALLARGVNLLSPHIAMQSLAGGRKYDWAQTFSDHSPWWPAYRTLADHDARASYLLAHSTRASNVLVLHPTLTGWLHAVPKLFRLTYHLQRDQAAIEHLREGQAAFLRHLTEHHVHYDLGDEWIMAETASVEGAQIHVGARTYDVVVIPPGMETMLASTCHLLAQFMADGGTVIAAGPPPATVHGRPDPRPAQLATRPGWIIATAVRNLVAAIHRVAPPVLSASSADLLTSVRRLDDGRCMLILANPGPRPASGEIRIRTVMSLEAWSPDDGSITDVPVSREESGLKTDVVLPPRSLIFWIESDKVSPAAPAPSRASWRTMRLGNPAIARQHDNVLPLPFCSLQMGDHRHPEMPTAEANEHMWKAHGFPQDPWEWTIQYKREYVDHVFPVGSGYAVEYNVDIDPPALEAIRPGLKLAVERPWLYTIEVNGQHCPFDQATRWFDEDMRIAPVGHFIRAGRNIIRLSIQPMQIHAEIAPVYLLGDFAVRDGAHGLMLVRAQPLTSGGWRDQGLPFYPWTVRYTWPVSLETPATAMQLELTGWHGSAARVLVDEHEAGWLIAKPWTLDYAVALAPGSHTIAVEIAGNLGNFIGPFFHHGLPIPWSWRVDPGGERNLAAYTTLENFGLREPPVVRFR